MSLARSEGRSGTRTRGAVLFSLGVIVGGLAFGGCGGDDSQTSGDAGPDTGEEDATAGHDASADGGRGPDATGSDAGGPDARPASDGGSETGALDAGGSDGEIGGDAETRDGGADARADAEGGSPTDAGTDVDSGKSADSGSADSGKDASAPDAEADAGIDSGGHDSGAADAASGDTGVVDSGSGDAPGFDAAEGGTCTVVPSFNVSCPTACNGARNYCVGGGVPSACLPIPPECLCEETHTCDCLLALIPSPCDGGVLRCTSGGPTGELFVTASSCQ